MENLKNFDSGIEVYGNESESALIVKAFLLDTHIENPDGVLITHGKEGVLLSEIFAEHPEQLRKMIEQRAKAFRLLGWEVENVT